MDTRNTITSIDVVLTGRKLDSVIKQSGYSIKELHPPSAHIQVDQGPYPALHRQPIYAQQDIGRTHGGPARTKGSSRRELRIKYGLLQICLS